jgi:hypothetical protein
VNGVHTGYSTVHRDWPTNRDYAQVCIDIPLRPDACATSDEMYP